jgi:DNA recombination protein RmuC
MEWVLAALALAVLTAGLLIARRGGGPPDAAVLLAELRTELARLARRHEELIRDVQHGREDSIWRLADATQSVRGQLGEAHRLLVEVRALEQGRSQQMDRAAESLRRLEAVIAGSGSRGAAGENILYRALGQLPPDLIQFNVPFGNRVVEYALSLPGGRVLPIDSKWTAASLVDRIGSTEDPEERRRLSERVGRDLRGRIREMTRYLDPARTLSLGLLAVPDSVYEAAPEVHSEGYREGVLVVPYSLALPFVLALYRLCLRFGSGGRDEDATACLGRVAESLRRIEEEVEGRLSRGVVLVENARDSLRERIAQGRRTAERRLDSREEPEELPGPGAALAGTGGGSGRPSD